MDAAVPQQDPSQTKRVRTACSEMPARLAKRGFREANAVGGEIRFRWEPGTSH